MSTTTRHRHSSVVPPVTPLCVDRAGLAQLYAVSLDHLCELVAETAWLRGDLPTPVSIGPDSHLGPGFGRLRFRVSTVDEHLVAAQTRSGGDVLSAVPPALARATLLDTRQLAAALAVPYDTMKKWCAAGTWNDDDLPRPVHIGRGSHLAGTTRSGTVRRGPGLRRWRLPEVDAWLAAREQLQRTWAVA